MEVLRKLRTAAVCSALIGSTALADPAISTIDGTLANEGTIRISGSNFGTPPSPTPYFFEQVDQTWINGAKIRPYAQVADDALIPTGDGYPWKSQDGNMYLERSGSFRGIRKSAFEGRSGCHDAWIETPTGIPDPGAGATREMYISWYFRPNFNPTQSDNGQGGSHKFIRVWDVSGGTPNARVSWTQMHLTYNNGGPSWDRWVGQVNDWNRMEIYLSLPQRRIVASVNGVVIHNINDFSVSNYSGLVPRLVGFDGSGDGCWNSMQFQMTDYFASNSRARVEIKATPTWDGTATGELQIPVSWTNNEIEIVLNQGDIGDFSSAYLYVVDASGNVNRDGFLLCDTNCPSPPESPAPF